MSERPSEIEAVLRDRMPQLPPGYELGIEGYRVVVRHGCGHVIHVPADAPLWGAVAMALDHQYTAHRGEGSDVRAS